MKLMIQIPVTANAARVFILNMASQGYEAHEVSRSRAAIDVHFTIEGETSADYSVVIYDDHAYIGVRPQ